MNASVKKLQLTERGSLQLTVGLGKGEEVTMLVTETTPGIGANEPVLVIWDGGTAPMARVALRSRRIAKAWEPFDDA